MSDVITFQDQIRESTREPKLIEESMESIINLISFQERDIVDIFTEALNVEPPTPITSQIPPFENWEFIPSINPFSLSLKEFLSLNIDEARDLLRKVKVDVSASVKKLVADREKARKEKDWKKADDLRAKINKAGFIINDTSEGPKLKRK